MSEEIFTTKIKRDISKLDLLEPKARAGDAEAQWLMGNAFYFGEEVETNKDEAVYWYTLSAQNGNSSAMARLGRYFEYFAREKKDIPTALYWYKLAGEHGRSDAKESLNKYSKAYKTVAQALLNSSAKPLVSLCYLLKTIAEQKVDE